MTDDKAPEPSTKEPDPVPSIDQLKRKLANNEIQKDPATAFSEAQNKPSDDAGPED